MQYASEQVWGFSHVYAAMPTDPARRDADYVADFMAALNKAAARHGIDNLNEPGPLLDLYRDEILIEAADAVGCEWARRRDVLLLTHRDIAHRVDWGYLLARHFDPGDGRPTVDAVLKRAEAALGADLSVDEADEIFSGLYSELDDLASVGWDEAASLRDQIVLRMADL